MSAPPIPSTPAVNPETAITDTIITSSFTAVFPSAHHTASFQSSSVFANEVVILLTTGLEYWRMSCL